MIKVLTFEERDFGNKINNLVLINSNLYVGSCIKIPSGIVISNDFFSEYINTKKIRKNLGEKIKSFFESLDLFSKIILRTSTNYEDLNNFTGAGVILFKNYR